MVKHVSSVPGIPAKYTTGPAMAALYNDRQRLFVWELLSAGDNNGAAAAERAGYSAESRQSLAVQAHRLMHSEPILKAIKEVAEQHNRASVVMATKVRTEIAANPGEKASDRLKAADSILSSAGMGPRTVHEHNVTITDADMIRELKEMAQVLGVDPKTLLGDKALLDLNPSEYRNVINGGEEEEVYPGLEDVI